VKIGIIGTGLIGASIGLAARARSWQVLGFDRNRVAAEEAVHAGALDALAERDRIYAECDAVAIATHLSGTLEELRALQAMPPRAPLVIDVGSVKAPVAQAARGIVAFVPTHPMTGSQRSGAAGARADLFEGRVWAYVANGADDATDRACALIQSFGAIPVPFEPDEHDRIVALTSHLPQVIASAFAAALRARGSIDPRKIDALCGPAARELLRLGESQFPMWNDVLTCNAEYVAREGRLFSQMLGSVADAIAEGNTQALAELFAAAAREQKT
jgi:prephenate dehydrogenase